MEYYLFLIVSFLRTNRKDWGITILDGIPEENSCFEVVRSAIKKTGMKCREYSCYGDWYLDGIEYTADQYFMNLTNKVRKDILYCKRRLQNMGNLSFKLITDRESVDHYMDLYYKVYSRSWQKKEGIGPNFHRDLAHIAAEKNWLRLGFLMFNDCPISSQFWISSNGTAFILKTIYDQNYRKYSPGKVLTMEMIRHIITVDNVRVIDYIHGDEPYKQDWTPKRRTRKGLHIYNNNLKGRYLAFLNNQVLPIARKNKYLKRTKEVVAGYLK
jgi:CelD/BcsL family acetyltransferase involved in cellulose biosynthesis